MVHRRSEQDRVEAPTFEPNLAVMLGGNFADGANVGPFAPLLFHAPSSQDRTIGLRCVVPG